MTRFTWLGMAALALILTGSTAVSNDESPADETDPVVQDRVTGLRQGGQAQRAPRGQRPSRRAHKSLDASLKVGSGGYNRPARHGRNDFSRGLYGAGSSKSIYRVGRSGNMVYDANAAFNRTPRYDPTGHRHRGGRSKRFRYSR